MSNDRYRYEVEFSVFSFAETCEVLDNGEQFRCICMEGYTGRKCDT